MGTASPDLGGLATKVTEIARRAGADILEIYTATAGVTTVTALADPARDWLAPMEAQQAEREA